MRKLSKRFKKLGRFQKAILILTLLIALVFTVLFVIFSISNGKGNWLIWFAGIFFSALIAVDILFTDELFRYRMSFRIREPEKAEPSEWEMDQRYIGWMLAPLMTVIVFLWGLFA
ncbi:MAG: hypothetical protein IKI64_11350 [Clostridia bacterium]|nr:hypothetical protein [Clostridia bacterium]